MNKLYKPSGDLAEGTALCSQDCYNQRDGLSLSRVLRVKPWSEYREPCIGSGATLCTRPPGNTAWVGKTHCRAH